MECTNGEWPCEMSTYIAGLEADYWQLKDSAHDLAMLLLQSDHYKEVEIRDAVDNVLCLTIHYKSGK